MAKRSKIGEMNGGWSIMNEDSFIVYCPKCDRELIETVSIHHVMTMSYITCSYCILKINLKIKP